ncbi:hypothetical protein UFOVP1528_3 [uncultured Caudovirales phage]|uniref:Uncharacterized protein n=1 Tax=uncultured Caudovirales phage TaxID=2100421 RepID=A0A6J7XBD4_9CAUD|nr:hypothetical protein UFOVP905_23 [uncultured Caudovirales phage]CAB4182559.1 hypothetical protein UFOVP1080_10 [uncultured Caudovirales phage]CAB4197923.1 hypothetical protein UFOVP1321_48 [uncultured Caudovirales phage]CAB4212447.1 hypothetical protein UFOVP1432_16 [uncultured Caudovirales phage]CAB5227115.1 hypothetical protein UFOVP1528_3 [uncultured Caudovirales phage]
MYVAKLNGRKLFGGTMFESYEKARSSIRAYIRKLVAKGKANEKQFGFFDEFSRNPTNITSFGFEIKRITA